VTQRRQAALADHYRTLQSTWKVVDRTSDYARLVVPNGNSVEPFHRWFHLKEAYSSQLLVRLLKDSGYEPAAGMSLLDPFAGSGTTAVAALQVATEHACAAEVLGIERNPLLWTVAAAKAAGACAGRALDPALRQAFHDVKVAARHRARRRFLACPASATLSNPQYFPPEHVDRILRIREAITTHASGDVALILRACLAAAVEPAGRLRRDGRALRHEPDRVPQDPGRVFSERVQVALEDLAGVDAASGDQLARVMLGDGRRAELAAGDRTFDWIVFSPPYPNNIDYTEVYKTEAWALGCYSDAADMKSQRLATVRSHPSVRFPDEYAFKARPDAAAVEAILAPLVEAVPQDRYAGGRRQVVTGYADDMLRVLASCRPLAKNDARLVFVVGSSVHGSASDGSFVIAADLIMCALAELAGWQVEEIRVARKLARRGQQSDFLRESVVVLRPR
jgi:hypothetical protein